MATLPSGSISLGQVQDFFDGETDTSAASMSEYYERTYQIPSSGTLSLNDFRGVEGYYGNRMLTFQAQKTTSGTRVNDGYAVSIPTLGSSSLFSGHTTTPVAGVPAGLSNATYLFIVEFGLRSSDDYSKVYYHISFASPGSSFGYGGTHSGTEGLGAGASNGVTGLWSGGSYTVSFNFGSSTFYVGSLWKMTLSTSGAASSTGGYLPDNNSSTGSNGNDMPHYLAQSNGTRGVYFSGREASGGAGSTTAASNKISYITITSTGNASTFGNMVQPTLASQFISANANVQSRSVAAAASRVLLAGGEADAPSGWEEAQKRIDYITVDTTGNSTFLGNLTKIRAGVSAGGNGSRCVWGGGTAYNSSGVIQTEGTGSHNRYFLSIDYNNPFSTSNAADWGDFPERSGGGYYGSGSSS